MLSRDKVIEAINKLPEKFSVEEVLDRIFLLEKIEIGQQQSRNGQVTKDQDLNKKLPEWLL